MRQVFVATTTLLSLFVGLNTPASIFGLSPVSPAITQEHCENPDLKVVFNYADGLFNDSSVIAALQPKLKFQDGYLLLAYRISSTDTGTEIIFCKPDSDNAHGKAIGLTVGPRSYSILPVFLPLLSNEGYSIEDQVPPDWITIQSHYVTYENGKITVLLELKGPPALTASSQVGITTTWEGKFPCAHPAPIQINYQMQIKADQFKISEISDNQHVPIKSETRTGNADLSGDLCGSATLSFNTHNIGLLPQETSTRWLFAIDATEAEKLAIEYDLEPIDWSLNFTDNHFKPMRIEGSFSQ